METIDLINKEIELYESRLIKTDSKLRIIEKLFCVNAFYLCLFMLLTYFIGFEKAFNILNLFLIFSALVKLILFKRYSSDKKALRLMLDVLHDIKKEKLKVYYTGSSQFIPDYAVEGEA